MIKITEKNRALVFLGATLVIGIIIIGVLTLVDNSSINSYEKVENPAKSNVKDLEDQISKIKNKNYNPQTYSTISGNIESSYQQDLITVIVKNNLISKLTTESTDLVFDKCELFLNGSRINSSTDLLAWLKQIETISSKSAKGDYYGKQINAYEYYVNVLPERVDNFILPINFEIESPKYNNLKNELETMPMLDARYKSTAKFESIRKDNINKLGEAYRVMFEEDLEMNKNNTIKNKIN